MKKTRILFAASEVTPIIKTGGLADVVGALPMALRKEGLDVRIAIPAYTSVLRKSKTAYIEQDFTFNAGQKTIHVQIYSEVLPQTDIPVYLIHTTPGLTSEEVYPADPGVEQDRFLIFSLALLAWLERSSWQPLIIHGHDWMTGSLMHLIRIQNLPYQTLLTIHNAKYQGQIATQWIQALNIPYHSTTDNANQLEIGIQAADKITTVSPTYAQEILTAEYGYGLEEVCKSRQPDMVGIINGLDQSRYSPDNNPWVKPGYTVNDARVKKGEHKCAVQRALGLVEDESIPLYGVVGRASRQKGMDLLAEVLDTGSFLTQAQLVILAGLGTPVVEELLVGLAERHPHAMRVILGFDEIFSHQLYAASDFLIMPSKYEPCGLTQLIAMKYGTVPIVRKTGGLADTVIDIRMQQGVGIVFNEFTGIDLQQGLDRSLNLYQDRERLYEVMVRGMGADFSWDASVQKYIELYRLLEQKSLDESRGA